MIFVTWNNHYLFFFLNDGESHLQNYRIIETFKFCFCHFQVIYPIWNKISLKFGSFSRT